MDSLGTVNAKRGLDTTGLFLCVHVRYVGLFPPFKIPYGTSLVGFCLFNCSVVTLINGLFNSSGNSILT